jgi:hypothetical protein
MVAAALCAACGDAGLGIGGGGAVSVQQRASAASPDGTVLLPGTGGSLTSNDGVWTFSDSVGGGGNLILLAGSNANGGQAVKLEIANGGRVYAQSSDGTWWSYSGWWQWSSGPGDVSPISPDGTVLLPGTGASLTSSDGVWTFSGNLTLLNGSHDNGGQAVKLEIAEGGKIYAQSADGEWWVYSGYWQWSPGPSSTTTTTTTTTPPPLPANLIQLGGCGSCQGGPQGIADINDFQTTLGRDVDYVLAWGWAPTAHDMEFSITYLDQLWPSSFNVHFDVPMIVSDTTFADATNGIYDSSYIAIAQTIANRDPGSIVRMGHEMNGNWYPWSMDGPAGTAEEFARAYAHIVTVMRSVAPKLKFAWNPGIGEWAGLDAVRTWPGDAYVDFISLDMYEDHRYTSGTPDERWTHFLEMDGRGLDFWASFAEQHGKPLAFDEWASDIDDGMLVQHMHDWMSTHEVAYQMYWDSDAAFPGSFATNPVNGALYRQLFGP